MRTAIPANSEKVCTAGITDRAPGEVGGREAASLPLTAEGAGVSHAPGSIEHEELLPAPRPKGSWSREGPELRGGCQHQNHLGANMQVPGLGPTRLTRHWTSPQFPSISQAL